MPVSKISTSAMRKVGFCPPSRHGHHILLDFLRGTNEILQLSVQLVQRFLLGRVGVGQRELRG
jgi:hypothetical protein